MNAMKNSTQGCIYKLTNLANGCSYIGQDSSGDPENHRWKDHLYVAEHGKGFYLHRAIKAYKFKFSSEIIWVGPLKSLNAKEKFFIKKFRTFVGDPEYKGGYNLTRGGEGASGLHHSARSRSAQSKKMKALWGDELNRAAWVAIHKAAMNTPKAKSNVSSSQKLRWKKMTLKEKVAFGKKLSKAQLKRYKIPGALEIMCLGQAKRFADPEKRAINAAAHRTEEFRALDSAKTKAKWADPKWRRAWIKSNTTPEAHVKKSVLGKAWHADPVHQIKFLAGTKSVECSKKHSESNLKYYADPTNHAKHLAAHRTEAFRKLKAENTRVFFAAMTPEERKAYWHKIHPNGIRAKV
jgi:hypothetical protein